MSSTVGHRLGAAAKVRLWMQVLAAYSLVRSRVHREALPSFVERICASSTRPRDHHPPARLSRAVHRSLRLGRRQPTCLVSSLVLFKLLREQGDPAELVIGLPANPTDKDAHAWVELKGVDVGPPPGRSGHAEMARFG